MKRFFWVALCLLIAQGCTSAVIPNYLPDEKPYTKRFQADHKIALQAVRQALRELGWDIEQTLDPLVYEQDQIADSGKDDILIMTAIRQTPLFVGTRYAKMNIYIRSLKDVSDVEIRYLTVTSLPFKNVTSYSNDSAVDRVFEHIEKILTPAQP